MDTFLIHQGGELPLEGADIDAEALPVVEPGPDDRVIAFGAEHVQQPVIMRVQVACGVDFKAAQPEDQVTVAE